MEVYFDFSARMGCHRRTCLSKFRFIHTTHSAANLFKRYYNDHCIEMQDKNADNILYRCCRLATGPNGALSRRPLLSYGLCSLLGWTAGRPLKISIQNINHNRKLLLHLI